MTKNSAISKKGIAALALSSVLIFSSSRGGPIDECYERAESQEEMNHCAISESNQLSEEMKHLVSKIEKIYENDKKFIQALHVSQKIWVASMEADLTMRYPERKNPGEYGSVFPVCFAGAQAKLIASRIEFLKQWLVGSEEGNACSGSLKVAICLQPNAPSFCEP